MFKNIFILEIAVRFTYHGYMQKNPQSERDMVRGGTRSVRAVGRMPARSLHEFS